jgi:P4 family phage/plasmid primase-like protien
MDNALDGFTDHLARIKAESLAKQTEYQAAALAKLNSHRLPPDRKEEASSPAVRDDSASATTAEPTARVTEAVLLSLVRHGFKISLLDKGRKTPLPGSRGHLDATDNPDTIRDLLRAHARHNFAAVPRVQLDGTYTCVLDLDIKRDGKGNITKDGITFFQRWCAEQEVDFEALTTTGFVVRTAGGGLHIYLRVRRQITQGANLLGKKDEATGVDTRTDRGYVVAPGSVVEGGVYCIISAGDPLWMPPELEDPLALTHTPAVKPPAPTVVAVDQDRARMRAIDYLEHEAPLAVEGQGGDSTTYKVACRVKDEGVDKLTCHALMLVHWNTRCTPPWSDEELQGKVEHAYKYGTEPIGSAAPEVVFADVPPEDIDTETTKYEFKQDWSDAGNANLLVSLSKGRLRFIPETKSWLHWDAKRWAPSRTIARRSALRVPEHYHAEAEKLASTLSSLDDINRKRNEKTIAGLEKWEKTCRSKKTLDAMIDLASTHPRVELSITKLDARPTLLGVSNGVVDLQTGQLRNAAQDEYIALACPVPYHASATAPIWERTIAEVTGRPGMTANDSTRRPEVAEFLQRVLGYALTGLIREHTMFFFNGAGGNGKNVVADTMRFILGDYATGLPSSCLLQTKYLGDGERPTPYAAGLYRKRFVVASETKAGFKLDTEFVKSQTGDTFQKARHLRQDPFEFESTHKLFLMTNAMPEIDHLDEAIRGRLIVFPFDRTWNRPNHPEPNPTLPNADPTLSEQLRKEAPGILRWLVAGAVNYFTHGLSNAPAAVRARTLGYLAEQDGMAQWLKERCVPCEHKEGLSATGLCEDYNAWAQENGKGSMSQKQFSAGLRSRHFEVKDTWRDGRNHKLYTLRLKRPYDHIFDE